MGRFPNGLMAKCVLILLTSTGLYSWKVTTKITRLSSHAYTLMPFTIKEKFCPGFRECNVMAPNEACYPETGIIPKVKGILKVVVISPAKIK